MFSGGGALKDAFNSSFEKHENWIIEETTSVIVYFDDIVLLSKYLAGCIRKMKTILKQVSSSGLRLKLQNWNFHTPKYRSLGFLCPEKVLVVTSIPLGQYQKPQ